jgi:hypothetical protein
MESAERLLRCIQDDQWLSPPRKKEGGARLHALQKIITGKQPIHMQAESDERGPFRGLPFGVGTVPKGLPAYWHDIQVPKSIIPTVLCPYLQK